MKASEIRQKWLDFFASKQHAIVPSASLVPHNDPSLLWINAGMAPLKSYFDGREIPDNPRLTNAQKCIRTNDIENVGKTRRHHTFFEMLGNFSIGDYFKKEAIEWAWEFLTDKKWIGFDPNRLSVTVYPEDTEAVDFWKQTANLPDERIYRLKDNFWDIGEGPCGPCTEIFYDRGDKYGDLSDPECNPGGENERFLEVWNLVFSQFNHNPDGSYTPLPNKNIDTGAGLERFASVLQDVDSNFDTDLFQPIIQQTCGLANVQYHVDLATDVALKVIADHIRTVTFSVGDGVLPSNEGRGYVIRRLLRRAVRYGKVLGLNKPFLFQLVGIVGEVMGAHYPEVNEKREWIEKVIRTEEERFHETLTDGLQLLAQVVLQTKTDGSAIISGADAFKLYDTYGFPFDLTEDYAAEQGLSVDRAGFDVSMNEQRERARAARQDIDSMKVQGGVWGELSAPSQFVGYDELYVNTAVIAIVVGDELVQTIGTGQKGQLILEKTPFYAESGGQVSDHGTISTVSSSAVVQSLYKAPHGQHVHVVEVSYGNINVGDIVEARVAKQEREDIVRNHTATHLLHKALKEVLGDHVNQAGSLVEPERLRFDFTHYGSMTEEEWKEIELRVNQQIWKQIDVQTAVKAIADAKAMGAMALFGEKYGDIVRVVTVGSYSLELCGGCHVKNSSQIGLFKLVSESGIGSGTRRIEAVTGRFAYQFVEQQLTLLADSAELVKAKSKDLPKRIEGLQTQIRDLSRENESLLTKLQQAASGDLLSKVVYVGDIQVLAVQVEANSVDALRSMMDALKQKLSSAVIVLGSVSDGKVNLMACVSEDLQKRGVHAGKLIKEVAATCGGSGGGRPDTAQAGAKEPAKLAGALQSVADLLLSQKI